MHDVFISFATPDQPKAEQVRQVLEKNGISCWFAPESMRGSQDFAREIPKAIKSSKAMVLIWSESAQKSQWVEKEVDYAIAKGCPIFPFTLETFDFDEKFDFLISHAQRYAAYLQEEKALGKLVRDLLAVMERDDAEVVIDKESAKPKKKPWLWAAVGAAAVVIAAIVACIILFGNGGMDSGDYVIWNPAYGKALTDEVVSSHYLAGSDVLVQGGDLAGYPRNAVWQIEFAEDGSFTISRGGENLGMEPGYNGVGLGGDYTADRWVLEEAGDGTWYIKNVEQDYYLEWYADKDNWATYDKLTDENAELFTLRMEEAE